MGWQKHEAKRDCPAPRRESPNFHGRHFKALRIAAPELFRKRRLRPIDFHGSAALLEERVSF
jgi:hypothetical protein